jgi:hypothetical protein
MFVDHVFVDHSIYFHINDFQVKNILWSKFSLMQSDGKVTYKNEGNVSFPFNSFQDYEEENDILMNIIYETHASLSSSSNVIGNASLVCKLERDKIIYGVVLNIDDIGALHYKVMVMSVFHVINSKSELRMQNEVLHHKVFIMSDSHFFSLHGISLKKTFSVKNDYEFSNYDPYEVNTLSM